MQIKIINVGTAETVQKGKNSWTKFDVTYKDLEKNRVTGKSLVSFDNPEVYEFFKHVNQDDVVSVKIQKNDKTGFWDWIEANLSVWPLESASAPEQSNAKPTAKTFVASGKPVSQYETRDERAARQQLIIRQSSISSAIELLQTSNKVLKVDETLNVAQQFVNWVNDVNRPDKAKSSVQELIDMPNDVVE